MAERIEIQMATREDAQAVAAMSRDLIEYGLPWTWTPTRTLRHVRHPESVVIAARCRERLAGFAIMGFGTEEAHLNLLAVAGGCQRRGIGRSLVKWLEASARVAGISVIYLEVRANNYGGQAFYRRLGYREFARARGYYCGRETAVCMAHDLWETTPLPCGSAEFPPRWADLLAPQTFSLD